MVPFAENTELSRIHLVQFGARTSLQKLGVIDLLVGIGLRLVEENKTFKIRGTLVLKTETMDKLDNRILGNIPLTVNSKLQMGVARQPRLLGEEAEAECRHRLLLELIVVPQIHSIIGVLQDIWFNYMIFSSFHTL